MASNKEIKEEIKRVKENPYDDIPGVVHTCNFKSESAYVQGLKFALDEEIERDEFASKETVKKIVERIKSEVNPVNIEIVRKGEPPKYMDILIRVYIEDISDVDTYSAWRKTVTDIVREEEGDSDIIYTMIQRVD